MIWGTRPEAALMVRSYASITSEVRDFHILLSNPELDQLAQHRLVHGWGTGYEKSVRPWILHIIRDKLPVYLPGLAFPRGIVGHGKDQFQVLVVLGPILELLQKSSRLPVPVGI